MKFELTNKHREYLGLDTIPTTWAKMTLKGDSYRPDSIIYFDGDILKRHIVSTENEYKETQYNEPTKDKNHLLPKTEKGKAKKITASVLESRRPIGVYFIADKLGNILIGNHTTQTTFFNSKWSSQKDEASTEIGIEQSIETFISESPKNHFHEINEFKTAKRKNIKYQAGDVFAFKISRTEYCFGQILLDINQLRKNKLIQANHGLSIIMGPPLIITIFAFVSKTKAIDLNSIINKPRLPSDIIMDNYLFYGEYEIIGHFPLNESNLEFPISYGHRLDETPNVFLQWGLIHLEIPSKSFNKYLHGENLNFPLGNPSRPVDNPYGYYGVGFNHRYKYNDIKTAMENNGRFDFDKSSDYSSQFDLRNPLNDHIRVDIFKTFGLNPNSSYDENRILTKTPKITDILKTQ